MSFFAHKTNRSIYDKLNQMREPSGKKFFSHTQLAILVMISRFDRTTGNYQELNHMISSFTGKLERRTLLRHLEYFLSIGVVSQDTIFIGGKSKLTRRIELPKGDNLISLKDYRFKVKKMKEYSYMEKNQLFSPKGLREIEPVSIDDFFCEEKDANFADITTLKEKDKMKNKNHPPLSPSK